MNDQSPAPQPALTMLASRQFAAWLASTGGSIALTTYQSSKVLFLSVKPGSAALSVFERTIERPMGLATLGKRLALASLYQIYTFVDAVEPGSTAKGTDAVFVPQLAHFTGDLDVHDLAYDAEGRLVFVNTLFSCLATVSETHSFRPVWKPHFISRLAAEDRCHLNGMAMRGGRPAFVTAVGCGDIADSWRENRNGGGVVIDVDSGEIVCAGLSMPHSPRWHAGRLFVLNSGTGEFGEVDLAAGRFNPIAFLPGYARGLDFVGDHAVVGLSAPRRDPTFQNLPLQERLDREAMRHRCGLQVVDLRSGDVAHWLTIEGVVTELFDVTILPAVRSPTMIGFKTDEIRRVISIEPA
jgi:uncharacterized protein (TIGR03032 family)